MKKTFAFIGACALTLASSQPASAQTLVETCNAPDENAASRAECVVLETLSCIESEDLACALAGYAPGFVKLHNGVDTNTVIDPTFWGGAFFVSNISLEFSHVEKVGNDQLHLTYVETVVIQPSVVGIPLPDATFIQHEDVMVTFNKDGQMTLWDQTGPVEEQQAVTDYLAAVFGI